MPFLNTFVTCLSGTVAAAAVSQNLAAAVAKLGATLQTNAAIHGKIADWLNITIPVQNNTKRFAHDITWPDQKNKSFIDWRTYKANAVNLGAWLEQEPDFDPTWWAEKADAKYPDEWSWCEAVGFDVCGPRLEERYATFITTEAIDILAAFGVNTIRIATTYAAWIKMPGSWLYSGNQQAILREITNYAIDRYHMHVILDLHSLPGGVNSLEVGEAFGHDGWFFNVTNLEYSLLAVDSVLQFIQDSCRPWAFTIAPINEPSDNLPGFGTTAGLTLNGTNWINTYVSGILSRIAAVDPRIPLMLNDAFLFEPYWSPFYNASTNLVIDSHVYFFDFPGMPASYVPSIICDQAATIGGGDGKFPIFVGEWSLQSAVNNSLADRKVLYDTQLWAFQHWASGGAFWNYRMVNASTIVSGNGTAEDYWSWEILANEGIVSKDGGVKVSYC